MGEDANTWSFSDHLGLIGLIVALIALGITLWRNRLADLKEDLADPARRAALLSQDAPRWASAYQSGLTRVITWADRFYGPNPSLKSFGRCLSLAFLYPIFAALLAWVIANVHSPGGFPLFPDLADWLDRAWRAAQLLIAVATVYLFFRNLDWLSAKINVFSGKVFPNSSKLKGTLRGALSLLAVALALAFAVAVAVVVALAGAFAGAGAGAVAVAVAGAVAFAFAVALAGAGAVAVAVAVAGAVAFAFAVLFLLTGDTEAGVALLFFYAALPLCNALTDFMSISATRDFLQWAKRQERPLPLILGILLVDLVIGFLCLLALCWVLTKGLDIWDRLSPGTLPLDWRAYWRTATSDWTQGIALWFMGFTTILPTLVHAYFGLAAVLTNSFRVKARALDRLRDAGPDPSQASLTRAAKRLTRAALYGWGLSALLLLAASWGIWALADEVLHWGLVERALGALFPPAPPNP